MASWPGVSRAYLSPVSLPMLLAALNTHGCQLLPTADPWADTRSKICLARNSLNQGHEQRREGRPRSSTVSGTLQPLSPRLSEASPSRTTSTAPIVPYNPAYNASRDGSTASSSKAANKAQRWLQALPSQQSNFSDKVATPARKSSAKLAGLMKEVIDIHEEVATKRFRARDMRHALRHKRDEENDRRLALRNKLNLISPGTLQEEAVAINAAIEDLQALTASYLALETEYHQLEDDLAQREYILDKRIRKLARKLRKQAPAVTQQVYSIDSDSDSSTNYSSPGPRNQLSPPAAEYLSFVGEVRMLRERLSELETEYLVITDQRHLRERIGMSLDIEALEFLDRYEEETAQIETELEHALRRARVHPEHKNHPDPEILEDDWHQILEDFLPEPPEDQPPPDPLLITELEDRSPFFESARPMSLNKTTFVNRWLLHRLRHSSLEILRFKSRPELLDLGDGGWDRDSISQMALMLWFRDETANMIEVGSNSAG